MLKQPGENYHQVKDRRAGRELPEPWGVVPGEAGGRGVEERYHQLLLCREPFRRVQVGASLAFWLAHLRSCTAGISVRQDCLSQGLSARADCSW